MSELVPYTEDHLRIKKVLILNFNELLYEEIIIYNNIIFLPFIYDGTRC